MSSLMRNIVEMFRILGIHQLCVSWLDAIKFTHNSQSSNTESTRTTLAVKHVKELIDVVSMYREKLKEAWWAEGASKQ